MLFSAVFPRDIFSLVPEDQWETLENNFGFIIID